MRRTLAPLVAAALCASAASAIITFDQLDEATFTVSHRIKGFGNRGKANRLVYEKASSLCIAAGYKYYELLDQESNSSGFYQAANATVRIRLHFEDGEGRFECETKADPEYVEEARAKLAEKGYQWPEQPSEEEMAAEAEASGSSSCTVEQIAAMVRAGLTDEQVQAACPNG